MTQTMRAAVLEGPQRFSVAEVPLPEPGPGEVLIRLEGCGVCASNVEPWEGQPWSTWPGAPGGMGHEGWGRITALGEGVEGLSVGDRVTALTERSYAEYDVARADMVVPLPASLDEMPVPGEPVACAMNIFARSDVRPGQTVAISVCDATRPQPRELMVTALLEELEGITRPEDVVVLVATGTHRANTDAELRAMLGDELVDSLRIVATSCLSSACETLGSLCTRSRNAEAGTKATRQLVRASTLAERGRPSMAGYSPNMSPGERS